MTYSGMVQDARTRFWCRDRPGDPFPNPHPTCMTRATPQRVVSHTSLHSSASEPRSWAPTC